MTKAEAKEIAFAVDAERTVSGLFLLPKGADALYVLAHGAGAGMRHPFLAKISALLAERNIGTLRYQFPYMERGGGRPDRPELAEATVVAALAQAQKLAGGITVIAGGKSFGGRMTSQAVAHGAAAANGLAFLGFPLHPPGKPSASPRGDHLFDVKVKMLFLQGTKDEFAELDLLQPLVEKLGPRAELHLLEKANHSFRTPGRKEADVMAELADAVADFARSL